MMTQACRYLAATVMLRPMMYDHEDLQLELVKFGNIYIYIYIYENGIRKKKC